MTADEYQQTPEFTTRVQDTMRMYEVQEHQARAIVLRNYEYEQADETRQARFAGPAPMVCFEFEYRAPVWVRPPLHRDQDPKKYQNWIDATRQELIQTLTS